MGNTAFPITRFQKAGVTGSALTTLQEAWALMSPEAQAAENEWIEQVSDAEVAAIASFPSGGGVPTLSGGIVEISGPGGSLATGSTVTGATASTVLAVDASGKLASGPPTSGVTSVSDNAEQLLALLNGPDPAARATGSAGAPTTGTWLTGQAIVDSTGLVWVCTAGGTPGTWAEGASGGGGGISGVTVSGTPAAGDVLTSTSSTAATWKTVDTLPVADTGNAYANTGQLTTDLAALDAGVAANASSISTNSDNITANTTSISSTRRDVFRNGDGTWTDPQPGDSRKRDWYGPGTGAANLPWQPSTSYEADEVFTNGGVIYQTPQAFTSGTTFASTGLTPSGGGATFSLNTIPMASYEKLFVG